VFGTLRLLYRPTPDGDYQVVGGVGPKAREIVAYLALHPDGVRRDTIIAALWPGDSESRRRLDNRFYAALSQLRRTLRTATAGAISDIVEQHDGRYHLRRDLLTVDIWQVQDALEQRRRAASTADRFAAILPVAATYTGHLSDDLTGAWAEPHREQLRRQVSDALASLTASIGEDNPQRLELLESLRRLDPYNEELYQQIARTQARLGQHDAVEHTYALLLASLADIDQQPSPDTTRVFRALQRPGPRDVRSA
jgi:DNA-binding SARP family transcriptional activator